jgi:hypothetical protein
MHLTAEQLVALITEHSWGVPVRDMEALISLGGEAAEAVVSFLRGRDLSQSEDEDLLWLLVALGELQDPRAVPVLLDVMGNAEGLELPVAAAEALGKMGIEAVRALESLLDGPVDPRTRILAYAALSLTGCPEAWEILEEAQEVDPELDFAVARALAERGAPGDQERVHGAYRTTEPWKRSLFEETLTGMASGRLPWRAPFRNWRLRYRRQPRQDLKIPRTWPDVAILLWQNRQGLRPDASQAPLTLPELRHRAVAEQVGRVCEDCGQPFRSPTGVPLCHEVEEEIIQFQLDRVGTWIADRWEDIHEVLDELDREEMEALQWPEESDEARAQKGEALETIGVVKSTLCWMVEEGVAGLSQGEKRLWTALQRARSRGE